MQSKKFSQYQKKIKLSINMGGGGAQHLDFAY